jgi:hypothetical protein
MRPEQDGAHIEAVIGWEVMVQRHVIDIFKAVVDKEERDSRWRRWRHYMYL